MEDREDKTPSATGARSDHEPTDEELLDDIFGDWADEKSCCGRPRVILQDEEMSDHEQNASPRIDELDLLSEVPFEHGRAGAATSNTNRRATERRARGKVKEQKKFFSAPPSSHRDQSSSSSSAWEVPGRSPWQNPRIHQKYISNPVRRQSQGSNSSCSSHGNDSRASMGSIQDSLIVHDASQSSSRADSLASWLDDLTPWLTSFPDDAGTISSVHEMSSANTYSADSRTTSVKWLSEASAHGSNQAAHDSGASSSSASDYIAYPWTATTGGVLSQSRSTGDASMGASNENEPSNGTQPTDSAEGALISNNVLVGPQAEILTHPASTSATNSGSSISEESLLSVNNSIQYSSSGSTNVDDAHVSEPLDEAPGLNSLQVSRPKGPKTGRPRAGPGKYSTN